MGSFSHLHRVTYADCTVGNHVYYGRYLELLEEARGAFFRSRGTTFFAYQQQGIAFPVIECHLRYKLPAHYDETLRIELAVLMAHGVRLHFGYRIYNPADELVLEAETFHACTTLAGKPSRLPKDLVALSPKAAVKQ